MSNDPLVTISERAAMRLDCLRGSSLAQCLGSYREFIEEEEQRLRKAHEEGQGGIKLCRMRADLMDAVIGQIFRHACEAKGFHPEADATPLALVAVGGYGRGELNPFSDIDIMFLHDSGVKPPGVVSEVIEQVLYLLWDIGFKVGHSTRTVASALDHAMEDFLSRTSLLEARLILGSKSLFEQFRTAFLLKCVRGHEAAYIEWRVRNQRERHEKYGGTVFVQEPNIKNGVGGLRDYQNLLWIAYFKESLLGLEKAHENRILLAGERKRLEVAYDFLLHTRTALHYLHGRPTDQLTLYYQGQIANAFQYPQKTVLKRSEEFMRDYYRHARTIDRITNTVANRLALDIRHERKKPGALLRLLPRKPDQVEVLDGFEVRDGLLYRAGREIFEEDPLRILRVFLHAQNRGLDLSPQLRQFIQRRVDIINEEFLHLKGAREIFQTILSRKGQVGRVLRAMHETGVLGAYLPEFGALDCLVQHEFYHRYTADEHTLRVVEVLDALIDSHDPKLEGYRRLFEKLQDPFVLYLAILLHDTGRAADVRHHAEASTVFAERVAKRLRLSPERRRELIVLVDNHTFLSMTAQRRNLDDPATVQEFARVVQSRRYLDPLMLLTLADGMGTTGESTWSDWKEALVWSLYRSARRYFEEGDEQPGSQQVERSELQKSTLSKLDATYEEEVSAHFDSMPDTYFQSFGAEEIAGHIRLFRQFFERLARPEPEVALLPATCWTPHPESGHTEVLFCAWDRTGLLERIAAAFAVAKLNILSADIYTREDNLVLDVFRVCDTNFQAVTHKADIALVEKTLASALTEPDFDYTVLLAQARASGSYHLGQELQFPTRIAINNDIHPTYTVVDIQTPDRLGLLCDILRGFSRAGVNIALSRISTEKGGAIDSFYVTAPDGNKIEDDAQMAALQQALRETTPLN